MNCLSARLIFSPTLLWTLLLGRWLKIRHWWDRIDETVILGALPYASDVKRLAAEGVKGVVNTCEEYQGPLQEYARLGIEHFWIPTVDYTHPELDDICRAVDFIDRYAQAGESVYLHCKAGRGRSATVAMCWLIKSQQIDSEQAQQILNRVRPFVNQKLKTRPVVREFEERFLKS